MVSLFTSGNALFWISLDKTIKLWKVFEKSLRVVAESNHYDGTRPLPPPTSLASLRLPRMMAQDQIVAAVPRKIYANAHAYHINSISINSDGETYISADDLRINLWNLNISDQSFSPCHFQFGFLMLTLNPFNHYRHCRYQTHQHGRTH
jgi:WD40 repeat protein